MRKKRELDSEISIINNMVSIQYGEFCCFAKGTFKIDKLID